MDFQFSHWITHVKLKTNRAAKRLSDNWKWEPQPVFLYFPAGFKYLNTKWNSMFSLQIVCMLSGINQHWLCSRRKLINFVIQLVLWQHGGTFRFEKRIKIECYRAIWWGWPILIQFPSLNVPVRVVQMLMRKWRVFAYFQKKYLPHWSAI